MSCRLLRQVVEGGWMEADIPVVSGGVGLLDEVAEYEALHASLETQISSTTSQLHVALSAVSFGSHVNYFKGCDSCL